MKATVGQKIFNEVCLDETHPYFHLNLTEILLPLRIKYEGMRQGYKRDAFEWRVQQALKTPITRDEYEQRYWSAMHEAADVQGLYK